MRQQYETTENHTAVRRIDELSDANVCHTWLWHLNKHHGPVLTAEEYLEAVRVVWGVRVPPTLCPAVVAVRHCSTALAHMPPVAHALRAHADTMAW